MLKIIFAGTPDFAVPSLQALLDSEHKVVAVYTQPDRRAGRGRKLTPSPIKRLALDDDIPLFQPESLRDKAEHAIFNALGAELMVVAAYGLILPIEILKSPKYGCINVHASLLPRWRGAAPIQRSILAGDRETGITIMQMDKGLDTGAILNAVSCPINSTDTAQDLYDRLAKLGAETLLMVLSDIEAGRTKTKKQDESKATLAEKITKQDAKIDWQQSAVQIERVIRAYYPWPVAYTDLQDRHIRLLQANVLSETTSQAPGVILNASNEGIDVATGKGVLRLLEIQLAGGKPLSVAAVLHSKKNFFSPGNCFDKSSFV